MTDIIIQQQSGQAQHAVIEIPTFPDQSISNFVQVPRETKIKYLELHRAALNGNWKTATDIFKEHPECISAKISQRDETALHVATAAKRNHFAKQLVNMMEPEDLARQNKDGDTAFLIAAASGNFELAKEMSKKNPNLAMIRNNDNASPLYMAAVYGHTEMVLHLHEATKKEIENEDRFEVLIALLKSNLYEKALQVLVDHPYLIAKVANKENVTMEFKKALHVDACLTLELANGEKRLDSLTQKLNELRKALELDSNLIAEVANLEKALEVETQCLNDLSKAAKSNRQDISELQHEYELQKALKLQKALELLAQRPRMYSCFDEENGQGIWKRCIKIFSGNNVVQNKISKQQEHIRSLLRQIMMSDNVVIQENIGQLIFVAAQHGNVEFLKMFIGLYPDLIWTCDDNGRSIFHIAVLHRQEDIFNLIQEIGSSKDSIATYKDKENDNNMLHMAGLLAPANRLNIVRGAALQFQSEFLWFTEVKKIMQPLQAEEKNNKEKTPGDIFIKEHKDLMKEGEKWMRDTSNSCMLVATLIATVVFAAAFTVPGGNKDQTGIPLFLESISFQIFAVSDAISLLFSCTSILVFLSILTSRYAVEDFLWKLPTKLIIGLVTLLISLAAMMVAFTATFHIIFHHGLPHFAIVVAAIAFVSVIMFIVLHLSLFLEIFRSTYMSRLMFQVSKRTLFS